MADDQDGGLLGLTLSLPQKLQAGAFGAGTIIFVLTYLISALLNGFSYTNTWIAENPVPVIAYWSIQIGLIPVYRNADLTRMRYIKQSIYSFVMTGAPFILIVAYYQMVPPQTGVDRLVSKLSYLIASATFINFLVSSGLYKTGRAKPEA